MNREDFKNLFKLKTTVPQDWDIHQIKSIVSTKVTDGPHETPELEETGVPFISAEAIKNDKIDFNLRRGYISEELHKQYSKKCKPQKNDIFIIKSGATTGNVAYVDVDFEFNIWSPLALVRCKEYLVYFKFLYYQLLSDIFRKQVELSWSFGTQENIGMRVIERLKVIIPKLSEQRRIAAYLDKTCSAIDTAIEKKQKQLETLDALRTSIIHKAVTRGLDDSVELKDSGVEWMGKLPERWKVDKLKYVTSLIVDGTHVTPTYMPEGIPFLRVTDIQDAEIDLARVKYITEEEHQVLCQRAKAQYGDILLSKNGTIGLVKIVNWYWEFSFFVSLCLLRPLKKLNPYYFSYYFESALVEQQLFESSKRTSVTNLHLVKIRELLIALPPVKEQKKIVLYLDEKLAHLSRLKLNILTQIETLSNYRRSLIHECVTGKRRITEADMQSIHQY